MNPARAAPVRRQLELAFYYLFGLRRKRTYWEHEIYKSRRREGEYHKLMPRLRAVTDEFFNYFRLDEAAFDKLIDKIRPRITRHSNRGFRVSHHAVSAIVFETCSVIYEDLRDDCLRTPSTQTPEWAPVVECFRNRWNCPNTLGAIDGKHVLNKKPEKSGPLYFNYKNSFSVLCSTSATTAIG
ncbi:hypothetical protein AAVH_22077 [Aphelenchoides avenae]|nr:hypothetical protein AAVH_22077 [Aphelenchus avenae]